MGKTRILVVDDEMDICTATENFLTRKGYEVFTAQTKDQAIEAVKQSLPQIILLDIRLKEASGLDVLKEAKRYDKDVKVIMVSALDDEDNIRQAKAWGADEYVAKPFTVEYLNDVLLQKLTAISCREKRERGRP